MKKRRLGVLSLVCLLCLTLCGCPSPLNGEIEYELLYSGGGVRNRYSYPPVTVNGTGYQLDSRTERVKEGIEIFGLHIGREYTNYLQILDEAGGILYEYEGLGSRTLWGADAGDGAVWVSCEDWITSHCNGYHSHNLVDSVLLKVNLSTGDILFRQEIEAYQMYLTTRGSRCYFYDCGEESEEKLFGLLVTSQENARIFYRELDNWEEEVTVYTFDYAVCPDIEGIESLLFSLEQEDEITVSPARYARPDFDEWILFEGLEYVIPLQD